MQGVERQGRAEGLGAGSGTATGGDVDGDRLTLRPRCRSRWFGPKLECAYRPEGRSRTAEKGVHTDPSIAVSGGGERVICPWRSSVTSGLVISLDTVIALDALIPQIMIAAAESDLDG